MKKIKLLALVFTMSLGFSLSACGEKEDALVAPTPAVIIDDVTKDEEPLEVPTEETVTEPEVVPDEEGPENCYRSELTNEWISNDLVNQRPIAVMVDNEYKALAHFGTSLADIVYEMMNSTANGRITRLMCLYKDYNRPELTQLGSIRSVRTTNLQLSPEYDAIVVHDGGPFYVDAFLANPFMDHLSGGFARIENGKPREYTEYVTPGEIDSRIARAKIETDYTNYYPGRHFNFTTPSAPVDLSNASGAKAVNKVEFPFPHNKTCLEYMPETQTYRYSEYNEEYIDELTGTHMEFTNVIIQECTFTQYDEHGYMNFFVHDGAGMHGWYMTNGHAEPITWEKGVQEYDITHFYNANGEEITLNTGKTYIALVPNDVWGDLVLE